MNLPEGPLDYNSGLWSRHCQGDTPAGGQGRAIELPVAHRGVPLREFRVLPLPGQGQGGGARAQGQAPEDLIINISCTIGRIIRIFLLKRLQTSRGVSLFLVLGGKSG